MSLSDRPRYTEEQLKQYFDYIGLPNEARQKLVSKDPSDQLDSLTALIRHHLCRVPFENLDLHYAPVKGISLNVAHLFDKVVTRQAGRGGYCMQNNNFLGTILRSLGYNVMSTGARVAAGFDGPTAGQQGPEEVSYGGFMHQVNIVTIGDQRYFVDVGFGSQGPTSPVPLVHGHTALQTGTADRVTASLRLTHGYPANNTSRGPGQLVWMYSVKYGAAADESKRWIPIYCFVETEFLPDDFEMLSFWVASRAAHFVNKVMCQKFIRGGDDGESLIGDITLNDGVIKKREFGVNRVLQEFKSEEDRVDALERYLDVKLSLGEREGIKGHHTAIR